MDTPPVVARNPLSCHLSNDRAQGVAVSEGAGSRGEHFLNNIICYQYVAFIMIAVPDYCGGPAIALPIASMVGMMVVFDERQRQVDKLALTHVQYSC
jgi:hypothetical protein